VAEAEVDGAEAEEDAGEEGYTGLIEATVYEEEPEQQSSDEDDELLSDAEEDSNVNGGVIAQVVRRGDKPRQGEEAEDCIEDGEGGGADAGGAANEERESAKDEPECGDAGEDGQARNVVAPGLDRLVGGFELPQMRSNKPAKAEPMPKSQDAYFMREFRETGTITM